MKIVLCLFLIIAGTVAYSQSNKNCNWTPKNSNVNIVSNKDNSFSFVSNLDTSWLFLKSNHSESFKKSKVLSITDGTDLRKYKIFKKNQFLFLEVKVDGKLMYFDTLANIDEYQQIKGYSLGSDKYKLKDRLNYLDTFFINHCGEDFKTFKENYYILYTTYLNISKFTRWYIRKKDLVLIKMEKCFKTEPLCPLSILVVK